MSEIAVTMPALMRENPRPEADRLRILDRRVFACEPAFAEGRPVEELARAVEASMASAVVLADDLLNPWFSRTQ